MLMLHVMFLIQGHSFIKQSGKDQIMAERLRVARTSCLTPLLRHGPLEQVAQDLVHLSFNYHGEQRFHNLWTTCSTALSHSE